MPKIYLSPSMQEYNLYYGGGNEEAMMNYLADLMVPYLLASGIEFTRNSPDQTLPEAIAQSNRGSYGMHLALHSNASPDGMEGQLRGIDAYYRAGNPSSVRFAEIAAENLRAIYPIPSRVVARPSTNLAEVLRVRAPSVLLELGYHDNPSDVAWLSDNTEEIARNIVLSLTEYFGIPFANPQPIRTGIAHTGGPNLNIRSMPTTHSTIVALIPDGDTMTIYSETDGWYAIRYRNASGYVSSQYVTLVG